MNLHWQKFDDFFALYEALKREPKLIYVIGETHHCYIGSVGGRGGENGLAQRYHPQYVNRSKAIFGSDKPESQPAFATVLSRLEVETAEIEPLEREIQAVFIEEHGKDSALFSPRGVSYSGEIIHSGTPPSFLYIKKKHNKESLVA